MLLAVGKCYKMFKRRQIFTQILRRIRKYRRVLSANAFKIKTPNQINFELTHV